MGQYTPGSVGALSNFKFDLNRLTTADRIIGVATLIAMISIWLPWYTASETFLTQTWSGSASGTGYHGWLWIEFLLALVVLVYLVAKAGFDELPVNLPLQHESRLLVATSLQFLLLLIAFFTGPSAPSQADLGAEGITTGVSASTGWGAGAFIGLLAAIVAAAPVVVPAVRAYLEKRNAGGAPQY
jgi:hypothetical protein